MAETETPQRIHSTGIERRLRQLMLSSAFTPEERELVQSQVPHLNETRMEDAIQWALWKIKGHDRYSAPLVNRIASTTEKIIYRLEEFERDPSKPIRPLLTKKQVEESIRRGKIIAAGRKAA